MKVSLFGATGALGHECLTQALEAGHDVTVLARSPGKLPAELHGRVQVVEGDALDAEAVARAIPVGTETRKGEPLFPRVEPLESAESAG